MIQPLHNNILVKPFESRAISNGGLFVPENCRSVSNKVSVVAVGNGKKVNVKVGDVGYRVKDWGTEVKENGETYFLMDASALIALEK